MRLTLRTVLAWLDGVLAPEELRSLGERVAASTVATGLTQRILLAAGRDDLAAPSVGAWGTPDDANFTADYLDNRLRSDQVEWFERICIQSDSRLAEVADCQGALADLSRPGRRRRHVHVRDGSDPRPAQASRPPVRCRPGAAASSAANLGFCSLRGQIDRVFQDAEEFSRPQRVEWDRQNVPAYAPSLQFGEHVGE